MHRPLPSSCLGRAPSTSNPETLLMLSDNECFPNLVIFPTDHSGVMLSLRVSGSEDTAPPRGSSGAFRASQTWESAGGDPSGMTFRVGADGYSTTLAATSCSSHHQTAWFYFRGVCWPITKADGTTCEPLEHLIPASLCPRTFLPKASGAFS